MGTRFYFKGDWEEVVRRVLKEFEGVVPANWTSDSVIVEAAKLAGHPTPHPHLPGARKALRDLIASGEVRHNDSTRNTRRPRMLTQNTVPNPSGKGKNDLLVCVLGYLASVHKAVMTLGKKLMCSEKEQEAWRNHKKEIDAMRAELEKMTLEVISSDSDTDT